MTDNIDLNANGIKTAVRPYRRLVTGLDTDGMAVFIQDDICPNVFPIMGLPDFAFTELWQTNATPVVLAGEVSDPGAVAPAVAPPLRGSAFRVVEFPPDSRWQEQLAGAMMHRTPSIDYAYVIDGEIYSVLDKEERLMTTGDVLIQRGTNHAWSNRSDKPSRVLFVLIGAVLPD